MSKRKQVDNTPKNRERFLVVLRAGGSIAEAARAAGVFRSTPYRWRAADPAFSEAWEEAYETGTDALEEEARRRAVDGVEEPVYYQGKVVGHVRKYSDVLLIFKLKARRPDKYRDTVRNEHTGPDGGPIETVNRELSDAERDQEIARLLGGGGPAKAGSTTH